jgi:hypothetical protein
LQSPPLYSRRGVRGEGDAAAALIRNRDFRFHLAPTTTWARFKFSKGVILQLAAVTLAPVAPLLLTMMPLEELLKTLFGIVF